MQAENPPDDFQTAVLSELRLIRADAERIDDRLGKLETQVTDQGKRLDNIFNGLIIGLSVTVVSATLLILARNAFEFWLVYHPPT